MANEEVEVVISVKVNIDEEKFTSEFMKEFRENFYDFHTLEQHREHLAQLAVRGIVSTPCFIEGYGPSADMGIEIEVEY